MVRYLILFVHVTSAMGVFAALGVEAAVLSQLRRASAPTGAVLPTFGLVRMIGAISLVGTLLSGIYLATTVYHWRGAWIGLGFLGLLITAGIGGTATRSAVTRLQTSGGDAADASARLGAALVARAAVLVAVVYLMTVKPGTTGALIAMTVGIVAALALGVAALRGRRGAGSGAARGRA